MTLVVSVVLSRARLVRIGILVLPTAVAWAEGVGAVTGDLDGLGLL